MRRKTHDEFISEMKINHPTLVVLSEYVNGRTKVDLKCNICGNEFCATPGSLYMGHGCPKCVGVGKKTHKEFLREMQTIHPTIEVFGEYIHSKSKLRLHCLVCGKEWEAIPNALLRGKGCPHCAGLARKTQEQFVNEMKRKHPSIEVIGTYKNNRTKVACRCLACEEEFMGTPHSMLDTWRGCHAVLFLLAKSQSEAG